MKKSLFLVPAVAFGIFAGVSNEASAQELNLESTSFQALNQVMAVSSVYENAEVLENGVYEKSNTSSYTPVRYFKFYYFGRGGANLVFYSEGNHKLNVLNGNLIKVNGNSTTYTSGLTSGWNYVEVIQTAPTTSTYQNFELAIGW
ncbi:hypothetical protein [Lysinibacillus fusiformis]|uniref:hypothetical protein n=1 Tax=Lysinibacillus fusiformis TaxID=28031 RepID=UPI0011A67205|nr:hypothetical protein [Lysinibacillus fusiformis]